jgi:hypothetical protein
LIRVTHVPLLEDEVHTEDWHDVLEYGPDTREMQQLLQGALRIGQKWDLFQVSERLYAKLEAGAKCVDP